MGGPREGSMHRLVDSPSSASGPRLVHMAGLDGLRALAIAAVFVFHAAPDLAPGGFLGVSLFFTVSGYLIGSLVLSEVVDTGRVDLGRFWARRARRLLPALLITLAVVVALAARHPVPTGFRGEALSALAYVANWHAVWSGLDYADLFGTPSPIAHLWSLAIEEQFYLVFPLVVALVVARGRAPRVRMATVAGAGIAGALVAQLLTSDRALGYYGTHVRAAELCAGVLLAALWRPHPHPHPHLHRCPHPLRRLSPLMSRFGAADFTSARHERGKRAWGRGALAVVGALGLAGAAAMVVGVDLGDGWLYRGGFSLVALLWAAIVLAAAASPLGLLLGWGPLAALGRISYGLYLAHWPVIVWLDEGRTGLDGIALFLLRAGVTVGVAAVSYHLLEQPIRERRMPRRRGWAAPALGGAFAASIVAVAVTPAATWRNPLAIEAASGPIAFPTATSVAPGTLPPAAGAPAPNAVPAALTPVTTAPAPGTTAAPATTAPAPAPPPVLAFVGDSVPYLAAEALAAQTAATGFVPLNLALPNCDGAAGHPELRLGYGQVIDEAAGCDRWAERWAPPLSQGQPAAVVMMLGQTTVLDRRVGGAWRGPCDADFRAWYEPTVAERVEWLSARSSAPIYLAVTPWASPAAVGIVPDDHRARTDCLNAIYDSVRTTHPQLRRLDIASWLCPNGPDSCAPVRADGLHFTDEGALQLAHWLRGQLAGDGIL
jgi:peptidoglycan/LPS O-acetylase OafA/YrhL